MGSGAVKRESADTGRQAVEREPVEAPVAVPSVAYAARASRLLKAGLAPSPEHFQALAQTAGNRAASRLLQRQSAAVTGQFLRVQVVGHSSARWKSARTAKQAAARNLALSQKRADAVKDLLLGELSGKLDVPIDVDVTVVHGDEGKAVTVGGYGEGSREALERTQGDRSADEQRDRRVDIEAELATTERRSDRIKVRRSAITRDWLFTITRFTDAGLGYAMVDLDMEIKNPISGKVATAHARLRGLGRGGLLPDAGGVGPRDIRLRTDRPVGFRKFHGSTLRVYMMNLKLLYGLKRLYIVFGGLRKSPVLIESKRGWGIPGGYGVIGDLMLDTVPDDFWETDEVGPEYKRKTGWGESLSVLFDTGSAAIKKFDVQRITEFIAKWAGRLH